MSFGDTLVNWRKGFATDAVYKLAVDQQLQKYAQH